MSIFRSKKITISRAIIIFTTGVISGIQIALYLFDYFDDGIADYKSLLIGIFMVILSLVFILYTFKGKNGNNTQ